MNFKLIVVIILVVLLLGGGIYESIYVSKTFENLKEKIDDITSSGEPYKPEDIQEIIDWWKHKSKVLALTMPHTPLNEVSFTLTELLGTVMAEDYKSSTAVLAKISGYAESLKDSYSFSANHIL
jgi:hypothetical protein